MVAIETKRESGETTTQYASKAPGLMVPSTSPAMRQHTSHTSAYRQRMRQHTSDAWVDGAQLFACHASAYVRIREHTPAYVRIREDT